MHTVHILRSPTGGSRFSRRGALSLRDVYAAQGIEVVDLTGDSAEASSAALERAVDAGDVDRLVVAGGDGMIHLAIQSLAETQIPLGIVPSGTGNDFAGALDLSTPDPNRALADGVPVDLLRVRSDDPEQEDRWIATIAILGFPADINARANSMPVRPGPAVYTLAMALELPSFARTMVDLEIDGVPRTIDSAMLAIGNTRYFGGGALICRDAVADDGQAHLTAMEGIGRRGMLIHLGRKSGATLDRPEVMRATGTRWRISTPGLELWGDGEPVQTTPLTIDVVPQALHVAGARPLR